MRVIDFTPADADQPPGDGGYPPMALLVVIAVALATALACHLVGASVCAIAYGAQFCP